MDDPRQDGAPRGIFDTLRSLLDRVLALLQARADLLTTELEEEVTRLVGVLLWAFAAILAVVVGASFIGVTILLTAPPDWRPWVAAGFGVVFLAVAALGYVSIRKIARAKPRAFDASLREFEKDRQQLRRRR